MPEGTETKTVNRWDSLVPSRWMTKSFTRTSDGFLKGRAVVTSVGVFTYQNKDGSFTRELRLPEEVFNADSLESMKMKPVANDHPTEKITDENVKKYQVGSLGSNPSSNNQIRSWEGYTPEDELTDGFHVAIDMIIHDGDAIKNPGASSWVCSANKSLLHENNSNCLFSCIFS
jgi:hypothetical protein